MKQNKSNLQINVRFRKYMVFVHLYDQEHIYFYILKILCIWCKSYTKKRKTNGGNVIIQIDNEIFYGYASAFGERRCFKKCKLFS